MSELKQPFMQPVESWTEILPLLAELKNGEFIRLMVEEDEPGWTRMAILLHYGYQDAPDLIGFSDAAHSRGLLYWDRVNWKNRDLDEEAAQLKRALNLNYIYRIGGSR